MRQAGLEALILARPAEEGEGRLGPGWVDVLREIPLFAPLPKRHVRQIANLARPHRYHESTAIVREGQRGETFFVIIEGEARVNVATGRGRTLKAGDWFGEMALLDGNPRSATVVATTPVLAMRIPRRPFLKLVASDSDLALGLLRGMAQRLRAASTTTD
jgi:CRP-like cAMP-binding protein